MAELRQLLAMMRTDTAEDAPAAALDRVVQAFAQRPTPQTPNVLQRLFASLRFDSAQLSPLGVRAAGEAATRQLLFEAGELTLDLRIAPAGEAWAISGQVLSAGPLTGQAELIGAERVRAALNELSEFTLPAVPAGDYQLVLQLSDAEVVVEALNLGRAHES